MKKLNIFENVVIDKQNEEFLEIVKNDKLTVERIVSNAQKSPDGFWYDQDKNEFVMVLQGCAVLEFEDKEVELNKGDYLTIEAHRKHRVKYTSEKEPTIWLAIFY